MRYGAKIIVGLLAFTATQAGAQTYMDTVVATSPTAYFRLNAVNQPSVVGGYTTNWQNGVVVGPGVPLAADPANTGAVFNGVNTGSPGVITTSLFGNSPGKGTIIAWVNPTAFARGSISYVAGESQNGNDLDLQFQDSELFFFTGGGENTRYLPDQATLTNNWHMIAATYDSSLGANSFRNIYWDGALGSGYTGGVNTAAKTAQFTIGYSPYFTGREFNGGIDEVAFYNRALDAGEVARIFAARGNAAPQAGAVPEPASWAMMIVGFCLTGGALRSRRRTDPALV